MRTDYQTIEYDVSSIRKVPSLLELCMLSRQAYTTIASNILQEYRESIRLAGGVLLAAGPKQCVPVPTRIEFRNLGVYIRIVYMTEAYGRLDYLTHINAQYKDGMWIMIGGSDDVAYCQSEEERAMICAVNRLRESIKGMFPDK